jgi:hypothetical protein
MRNDNPGEYGLASMYQLVAKVRGRRLTKIHYIVAPHVAKYDGAKS